VCLKCLCDFGEIRSHTSENSDTDEVESAGGLAHDLGGPLPIAGATQGLAKGTASVELANCAEKAAVGKPRGVGAGRKHYRKVRSDADMSGGMAQKEGKA
jgi:hypothetical protein